MKKMKMLFTAAAVLTVVGSALAFKPHTSASFCFYEAQQNVCKFIDMVDPDPSQPPIANSLIIDPSDCPDQLPLEDCNQVNRVIAEP